MNNYIGYGSYSVTLSPTAQASVTQSNPRRTIVVQQSTSTIVYSTAPRYCDGSSYPQACYNYASIAQYSTYGTPTCAMSGNGNPNRPLTKFYDSTGGVTQHNSIWSKTWITKTYVNPNNKRVAPRCERDEWPPAHFQQGRPDGFIRLLPGSQNGGVANSGLGGWRNFCKYPPDKQVIIQGGNIQYAGNIVYTTIVTSTVVTINVMEYNWFNTQAPPSDPWLLTANPCYPSILTQDPGFALLTWDHFYGGAPPRLPYSVPPTAQYTMGKKPPSKRSLGTNIYGQEFTMNDDGTILVDEGNSTRKASELEILEHFNLAKCMTPDCKAELEDWAELERQLSPISSSNTMLQMEGELIVTSTEPFTSIPTGNQRGSRPARRFSMNAISETSGMAILRTRTIDPGRSMTTDILSASQ